MVALVTLIGTKNPILGVLAHGLKEHSRNDSWENAVVLPLY